VVVLAADAEQADCFRGMAPADVAVVHLPGADPLARLAALARSRRADGLALVRADQAFIDPTLIDRLVAATARHPGCDYVTFVAADERPALLQPLGLFAEWCSRSALERADREARAPADRTSPTRYLYSHPELFRLTLIPAPADVEPAALRLGLETEDDWENAQAIVDALGPDGIDGVRIAQLLQHHPGLRSRLVLGTLA
jgi:spore coat polysaccharide biosynthesis protein SpsF